MGFDEFWFGEHHSGGWQIIADPLLMVARAAATTRRIAWAPGSRRSPTTTRRCCSTASSRLDHLTRGRLMFGVGAGALALDNSMMGLDPMHARQAMEESLEAMTLLLADAGPVTYTPEHASWRLHEAYLHLAPFSEQARHPGRGLQLGVRAAAGRPVRARHDLVRRLRGRRDGPREPHAPRLREGRLHGGAARAGARPAPVERHEPDAHRADGGAGACSGPRGRGAVRRLHPADPADERAGRVGRRRHHRHPAHRRARRGRHAGDGDRPHREGAGAQRGRRHLPARARRVGRPRRHPGQHGALRHRGRAALHRLDAHPAGGVRPRACSTTS
nr:LLM class flavin-dependent oxidoreductase [Angustibacter aerolatus]